LTHAGCPAADCTVQRRVAPSAPTGAPETRLHVPAGGLCAHAAHGHDMAAAPLGVRCSRPGGPADRAEAAGSAGAVGEPGPPARPSAASSCSPSGDWPAAARQHRTTGSPNSSYTLTGAGHPLRRTPPRGSRCSPRGRPSLPAHAGAFLCARRR
jgi:hypothetical protein